MIRSDRNLYRYVKAARRWAEAARRIGDTEAVNYFEGRAQSFEADYRTPCNRDPKADDRAALGARLAAESVWIRAAFHAAGPAPH